MGDYTRASLGGYGDTDRCTLSPSSVAPLRSDISPIRDDYGRRFPPDRALRPAMNLRDFFVPARLVRIRHHGTVASPRPMVTRHARRIFGSCEEIGRASCRERV